jgi:hypothetical protein
VIIVVSPTSSLLAAVICLALSFPFVIEKMQSSGQGRRFSSVLYGEFVQEVGDIHSYGTMTYAQFVPRFRGYSTRV